MRNPLGTLLWAVARRAARAYVAGPDLSDAVRVCRMAAEHGLAATICCWNSGDDDPEENAERYLAAIAAIAGEGGDCYLSLKAPDLRFSPLLVGWILGRAAQLGVRIHFDSLAAETADRTFALLRDTGARDLGAGCTLPGRWRRSLADADLAVELGARVRVVKGQWPDSEDPGLDPAAGFLRVVDRLAGRAAAVAVATHDPVLARAALCRLRAAGTPVELELLFGLPLRLPLQVARAEGVPVRLYIPYGRAWLPYAVAQIGRNPRIAWWTLRDFCFGQAGLTRL